MPSARKPSSLLTRIFTRARGIGPYEVGVTIYCKREVRRLRGGEYRVEREIDLHGLTAAEAKQALREFLIEALERRVRCVRIVHGKGLRSGHRGPVLKSTVSGVLRRTGAVLAYVSARPVDGGTGAVYVLLSPG